MPGNVLTGCSVLAPAGMLADLAHGLDVSIRTAGLLIPFAAAALSVGSPLTAGRTSRSERRIRRATTLAVVACASVASGLAPDYARLRGSRLVMLAIGALYTPQAGGTAALIVRPEKRGSAI